MAFNEWPKWVNGREAADADAARVLLSHKQDCGIHATDIVPQRPPQQPLTRLRHPDHERACTCGGVQPSDAALKAANIPRDPLDHDGDGRKGGSKPRAKA